MRSPDIARWGPSLVGLVAVLAFQVSAIASVARAQAVTIEGVDQRAQHMPLPDDLAEAARSPFSGEYLVAHRSASSFGLVGAARRGRKGGGRISHTPAPADTVTAAPFRA